MIRANRICAILVAVSCAAYAQDTDSLLTNDDINFFIDDSLSIFRLVDSLLQADEVKQYSQLTLRLGYNSNVLAAGRTLGITNFGVSPGLSYYNKSGLYGDLSGFWSRDFEPSYYLTIATVGYSQMINKTFSLITSYDRYFYNTTDDNSFIAYKNALSITPIIDVAFINLSVGYSYFSGDKKVHRLSPSIGGTFQRKKIWKIDRLSSLPSFSVLLGDESFTEIEIVPPKTIREAIQNLNIYGVRYSIVEKTKRVFGPMNYAFSLPFNISEGNWNFLLSYSYNIPKALPGETLTISESSFVSAGVSYTFSMLKKNKER